MRHRDVVEAIIYREIDNRKEVLMQKKTVDYELYPGAWCYFGGVVEERESPEETLKREIFEESSIEVNDEDFELIFKELYRIRDICEGTQYAFKVLFKGKLSEIKLTEGAGFAFFSREELDKLDMPLMERNSLRAFWDSFV